MVRTIVFFLTVTLIAGCGPATLSPGEIATEKKAIESVVSGFWKAYESRDAAAVLKSITSNSDLLFFGTDSAEVIRSKAQWETQVKNDWELFQTLKVGDPRNLSTLLSDDGRLGSIVCEIPVQMTVGGQESHSLFRFAATLQKESGEWRFVSGMAAVATVGQASADLVAKMKEEAAAKVKK